MAFVRKEDCPSIIDNICQNLEAKFWGEHTTRLVALMAFIHSRKKVILWEVYSEFII